MPSIQLASDYAILLKKVHETLLLGQKKIEQEKIRTYWQTGKHILDYILKDKARAGYGQQTILKLAEDLSVDESLLRRCKDFLVHFHVWRFMPTGMN